MSIALAPSPISQLEPNLGTTRAVRDVSGGHFAFARVKGDVCLVQVPLTTPSALNVVDAKIFRHEFITIFRHSETKTLHPADISIIEPINDYHVLYEEDSGTVFVARELLDRMRKMTEKPAPPRTRIGRYRTQYSVRK